MDVVTGLYMALKQISLGVLIKMNSQLLSFIYSENNHCRFIC